MEADEKGTAQTPPTLHKGEDTGTGILPKSGADRIKDPVFRDEKGKRFEGYEKPSLSMGETAAMQERQESSMVDFDDRAIWETLLKQAEANLKLSNAILSQTQRMVSKEGIAAIEPGRLESWYVAESDAANVATIAGKIVEQASNLCLEVKHVGDCCEGPDLMAAMPSARCAFRMKREVPSMLEQPTTSAMNAAAKAGEENPNPFAVGRGGKNLKFTVKSWGRD